MNALTKSFLSATGSAMLLSSLLVSCANENIFSSGEGKTVSMTVELTKPAFGDETRTSLEENNGNLDCYWRDGDQIWITDKNGGSVGYLTILSGYDGKKNAKFSGYLTNMKDGETTLRFYYLGTKKDAETATGKQDFSFTTQEGTVESLSYNDLLYSETKVNVADGDAYAEELGLQRQFAFARFRLVMPEGVEVAGNEVTVSGTNFFNAASLDPAASITFTEGSSKIKINSDNEFYMTVLPETGKYITPTFTVTVGEKTYTGTLRAREWKKSEYVRLALNEDTANPTYQGIPIDMTEKQLGEFEDPYPDEDPRNPLHIFAKGNLYRLDGLTNAIAESETENGALYQWGRNYGFMDNARSHGSLEGSRDFINWEDAFGDLEQPGGRGQRYWDFYVYSQNGETYYTGTGGVSSGYWGYTILDESKTYKTIDDLKAHPTKYFMDGRYNLGEYIGNLGGYLFSTCNPDYWVWSGGGNNWSERAEACGYEKNPCPEDWRMPTKEDWEAIAPYENINAQASLESLLRNHAEVRRTKAGISYAIKWLYRPTYLEIMTIIVDSDFKPSQLSDIVWENNPDVVARKFPYTGAIMAYGGYDGLDQVDLAYPYHPGVPDCGVFSTVQIGVGGNIGPGLAGYWMEDKGYVFKFTASEITGAKTSYVKIESANPVIGYAIRPVMDKK